MSKPSCKHRFPVAALSIACVASSGFGGSACDPRWVCFEDESQLRISADLALVLQDTAQKAYAWGDLNNNGMIDLVIVRKQPWTTAGKRSNVLLMNEGGSLVDRTFEYASASDFDGDGGFFTPTNDRDVVLVDVNNDGWLDIVTSTYSIAPELDEPKHISHPRVYINLGNDDEGNWLGFRHEDGRFPKMHEFADPRFYSVTAADINADGFADLFFTDGTFGNPPSAVDFNDRLFINDGTGHFVDVTASVLPEAFTNTYQSVRGGAADFNADGRLDLFKINAVASGGGIRIVYASGTDSLAFDAQVQAVTGQVAGTSLIAADLNNNGWNDVLITGTNFDIPGCQRRMSIYRNLADGPSVTLREEVLGGGSSATVGCIPVDRLRGVFDIAVFDIDGDGWPDLVLGTCTGTMVLINTTGRYQACPADLNRDGIVDADDLEILLGSFGTVSCGDTNGDGITDADDLGVLLAAFGTTCR